MVGTQDYWCCDGGWMTHQLLCISKRGGGNFTSEWLSPVFIATVGIQEWLPFLGRCMTNSPSVYQLELGLVHGLLEGVRHRISYNRRIPLSIIRISLPTHKRDVKHIRDTCSRIQAVKTLEEYPKTPMYYGDIDVAWSCML